MPHGLFSKKSSTYEQALEHLYKINLFRCGKAVNKCAPLLDQVLNFPARSFPSIHVAGTNGKGSVTTKIAKGLELSGLKVGLFISPHLLSFCERISINGELISQEDVASGLETLFDLVKTLKLRPTFFELVTNLACMYFYESKIDVAVFEVGLGGRTDATNIIAPILSVITSIGNDHAWVLGDTLELIAEQKGGIIREKTPVVLGPTVHYNSIFSIIDKQQAPFYQVAQTAGSFEDENRAVAKKALQILSTKYALNDSIIEKALEAIPPCRFQEMRYKDFPVIVDVAHNFDGIRRLLEAMTQRFSGKPIHVVFGMCNDKDYENCLTQLASAAKHIYLPEPKKKRLMPADTLLQLLAKSGYSQAKKYTSAGDALADAHLKAKEDGGIILICGSFYLMEEVLPLLVNSSSSSVASA
ncbi:MAG: bifunctional folylpolyglutamate synthase/dihydrofolate synthase [Chlamydiia bacterium]|nr:bifunctional folylpolyglutamate synthase/dihydrofolate synthase [Chlamydiia bacterium]MCP5509715.1 bifunctional folylpolyglutamate synthase/dihydrofolate synthase [Chlamydiales bacterium]HPE84794.1 cyanophycin synthetase [Chlamydiales bacterium]